MTDNYLTGFKRITWRQSLWSSSSRLSGPHSATYSEQQCVACNEATLASLLHIRFNDSPVEFIKNVLCKKKLLLFLWGAIVIWPFAALNYSDSTRLALRRIAVGVELVTRALFAAWHAAASLIVDFRCLALPFLSTCNTCHVRQCATPTATVKTADNAMATASVTSLPSLPPSPPLLACRGACIIIIIYSCRQSEAEEEQPLPEDADWFSLQLNHVASLIWFSRRCV